MRLRCGYGRAAVGVLASSTLSSALQLSINDPSRLQGAAPPGTED